jgi:hypothetical protein
MLLSSLSTQQTNNCHLNEFPLSRRALGAGALALGSKAVALSKTAGGASGAFKGLTGLALGGGAAAAIATKDTDSNNTIKDNKPVIANQQKLPSVALTQLKDDRQVARR